MQPKVSKSPGIDGIPAESYVCRGDAELESLRICLPIVGERGSLAQGLKDADIVSLYKNKTKLNKTKTKNKKKKKKKGEKSDCSNYRGILLFLIAGKILGRVLLNRLIIAIAQENTQEIQCWFRSSGGTTGMIFVYMQLS